MTQDVSPSVDYPRWSVYSLRDGERIERAVRNGGDPVCPKCSSPLETQPESHFFAPRTVLDETAHDLVCDECRRLWCVIQQTPRTRRLLGMRRLLAAVCAVEGGDGADGGAGGGAQQAHRRSPGPIHTA